MPMRKISAIVLSGLLFLASSFPAMALTVTARVSGGPIPIYAGPDDRYDVLGYLEDGAEIPVDECTQVDRESRRGGIADTGYLLWGSGATQFCHVPELGWVKRSYIVGRGLVNVTPPDFLGRGW
jgi:hypothetical protein